MAAHRRATSAPAARGCADPRMQRGPGSWRWCVHRRAVVLIPRRRYERAPPSAAHAWRCSWLLPMDRPTYDLHDRGSMIHAPLYADGIKRMTTVRNPCMSDAGSTSSLSLRFVALQGTPPYLKNRATEHSIQWTRMKARTAEEWSD